MPVPDVDNFVVLPKRIVRSQELDRFRIGPLQLFAAVVLLGSFGLSDATGASPNPVLNNVFPAGAKSGSTVEVTIAGGGLVNVSALRCSHPSIQCEPAQKGRFLLSIPAEVPNGHYDVCAETQHGLSSIRSFIVSDRIEQIENAENDTLDSPQKVVLNSVVNGRIEKAGDLDHFAFAATAGDRVIIECHAERIDSRLRAVLEIYDADGGRLAVNRGFYGIDPLIDFRVPADGTYFVKVFDLVYSGSADHVYRISLDTGPRVAFAVPGVLQAGESGRVTLYGWNLSENRSEAAGAEYETVDVEISAPASMTNDNAGPSPFRLNPSQATVSGFAYRYPGSAEPIRIGLTDVPVGTAPPDNHSPSTAPQIPIPCEVSGQLIGDGELDWFRIEVKRGEVLWLEAFGERIGSPVDLDVSILDESADQELARFSDEQRNIGGRRFPSSHSDPAGRWVAPSDGQFLILVRSLVSAGDHDPRRVYRLSVRREEPDFDLALIPRRDDPTALNVTRGGRTVFDVLAFRRRGLTGAIRVSARDLPLGITCEDVWLGPGVDRVPLVVSASPAAKPSFGRVLFLGHSDSASLKPVRMGSVVRTGTPNGWSRLAGEVSLAISGEAPIRLTADGHETRPHDLFGDLKVRHSPGSILDVAIHVERQEIDHQAPIQLTGIGLPVVMRNEKATIPAGRDSGHISFYLPPTLAVGRYTLAILGTTTVPAGPKNAKGERKTETMTVVTNTVTVDVQPAAFTVELDKDAPLRIRPGEVIQVGYAARRINGFISKIHTELHAPDGVRSIRGRGVTFVGQTDTGKIQIIANDDAAPGRQPFLRLYAVGVLEDEAVYHGSCFLPLEIVE